MGEAESVASKAQDRAMAGEKKHDAGVGD
jgi:hypothetical protein